jgi:lipoate-protein ligase B
VSASEVSRDQGKPADDARFMTCSHLPGILVTVRDPVPYALGWALQQQLHAERLAGVRADTLMLLEHLSVYTAGRRTKPADLQLGEASSHIPIEVVSRGGSVTYHGPGQLIAYPILALAHHARGAKAYVRMLENVLIRTLRYWDIHGYRIEKAPGVWTHDKQGEVKIASIGARIDRGITLHGFALNVNNDLSPFSYIVPCGIQGCRMTSMEELRQMPISLPAVAEQIAEAFSTVFQLEWTTSLSGSLAALRIGARSVLAATMDY